MSPRRRRSLAEREAEAIQDATITTSTTNRTTTKRKTAPTSRKTATSTNTTTSTTASARSVTIWVDAATWGRAQTVYLRSVAETGGRIAWKEWIAKTVTTYLDQATAQAADHQRDTASVSGQRSVWLPGAVIEQLDHAVAARAMAGQAATRSSLIVEALAHAVDADVPIFTGQLPRGPRPRT